MNYMKFTSTAIRGLKKKVNAPGKYSNTSDFNEIKILLLMFTGSRDLYLWDCISI